MIEQTRYYNKKGEIEIEEHYLGGKLVKRLANGIPIPFQEELHDGGGVAIITKTLTMEEFTERYKI